MVSPLNNRGQWCPIRETAIPIFTMKTILLFTVVIGIVTAVEDLDNKDLEPEETQRRIRDIIQSHENYKYGQHGGHDYDANTQKTDRLGDYSPEYRITYKNGPGHKGQGYYVVPISGLTRKLKPVNSKIYSYYPKIEPKKEDVYDSKETFYYPEKKAVEYNEPYTEEDGDHYTHDGHYDVKPVVYVPAEPQKYIAPLPKKYIVHEEKPHYVAVSPNLHVHEGHQHGEAGHKEAGYQDHGHAYHGNHGEELDQGHHAHKDYEQAGLKAHKSHAGHADHHSKYHNKAVYERDRGYHYEKSYAYDRIRAHHDIGKTHDSHAAYKGHHAHEDHHKKGHNGGHTFMYFKKGNNYGDYGYGKSGHHLDKHYAKGHGYHDHAKPLFYH